MKNTIKATPNHSARTFTLRTSTGKKYRTQKLTHFEFSELLNNTSYNWEFFIRNNEVIILK